MSYLNVHGHPTEGLRKRKSAKALRDICACVIKVVQRKFQGPWKGKRGNDRDQSQLSSTKGREEAQKKGGRNKNRDQLLTKLGMLDFGIEAVR